MVRPGNSGLAGSSATVLVVDDTPESLRFLTTVLEGAGITVLIAIDGSVALDLLDHVTPDLILMDGVMPGLDGFETTRRIKADPRFRHVPVIFMTGLTETEHVVRGLEAGGVDYVSKPIVIDELLARVRTHLANARVTHDSQTALDVARRPAFAIDANGAPRWFTPLAATMLERLFPDWDARAGVLPDALQSSLARLLKGDTTIGRVALEIGDAKLECTLLRRTEAGECLFRLTEQRDEDQKRLLAERHGLTSREAEVLLWISRGKQNREVSEILSISPRTVNKHLEQIFQKIGVENRSSAAAIAVGTLNG
ncbi:DNA-binding response regulator [Sphingomonas koreensis]|nr:DNA-binding response regulator [Sphingomonas koreensis]